MLNYWVLASLRVAESSGEVTLDDRITSLNLVCEILKEKPDYIASALEGATNTILTLLKRAARDVRQTLTFTSIELLFRLLEKFAKTKNQFAPLFYKTLTFLMVEFYWEVEIREIMLKHVMQLFTEIPTIPIAILCEPLLK